MFRPLNLKNILFWFSARYKFISEKVIHKKIPKARFRLDINLYLQRYELDPKKTVKFNILGRFFTFARAQTTFICVFQNGQKQRLN